MSLNNLASNIRKSFPLVAARLSFAMLVVWLFVQASSAQNVAKMPDFSGHWISEAVNVSAISGRQVPGPPSNVKIELTVKHDGDELRVKEISSGIRGDFTRESTYYIDGRGETNNGRTAELVYDSKTEIVDGKLLIKSIIRPQYSKTGSIRHTEEWEITSDRKKLRITTISGSGGVRNDMVFRLQP